MENIKGIRFGMFIIEKLSPDTFGDSLLSGGGGGGVATFWGSLFLGFYEKSETFMRSQKLRGVATTGTLRYLKHSCILELSGTTK